MIQNITPPIILAIGMQHAGFALEQENNITLPIILAIAGCMALLIGLFGGGVKAKEIEVPTLARGARILSSLLGIVLIRTAIRLSFPYSTPAAPPPTTTPVPPTEFAPTQIPTTSFATNTSTPTDISTATQIPTNPPTSTPTETPELAPGALLIPTLANSDKERSELDGNCREYSNALEGNFVDFNREKGMVYLQHDGQNLYVCIEGQPGSFDGPQGTIFIDDTHGDYIVLNVTILNSRQRSLRNLRPIKNPTTDFKWFEDPSLNSRWRGSASVMSNQSDLESAEFRLPLTSFNNLGFCGASFRISVYHEWVEKFGTGYGWPMDEEYYWNLPEDWELVQLANALC